MSHPKAHSRLSLFLSKRLRARNSSSRGSALLYVIASIVLLGAVGGGVAYFSSSSSTSQLTQTRAEQAYSAAISGLNYARTLDDAGFQAILAATGSKQSFTLDSTSFTLAVSAKTGACYPTNSIGAAASGTSLAAQYSANECIPPKTTGGEEPEDPEDPKPSVPKGTAAHDAMYFSGTKYDGDYYMTEASFNGGVIINGSIYYNGSDCLPLKGTRIGKEDGSSVICSNSCINIEGNVNVYGTVIAQGNVNIINGKVYGNVTSGKNVSIARWRGKVIKINGSGGNVYYYGTITEPSTPADIAAVVEGSAIKITEKPDVCPNYTLPEHKVVTPTSPDPNYGGQFTFVGTDISNTTTYEYPSFTTGGGASTCFDLSESDTYVNIFVQGNFNFGSSIYIKTDKGESCFQEKNKPSTSNYTNQKFIDAAKRIYIDVRGSSTFSGDGHAWIGTLFSKGNISTEGTFFSVGALYSNGSIDTKGGSYAYFVASDYANKYWP